MLIWLATVVIGLVTPIGIFGFLAALLVTIVAAGILIARGGGQVVSAPAPSADLPNGPMVEQFDSYIYRVRRAFRLPPKPSSMRSPASCRRSSKRWSGSIRSIRQRRTPAG